jgi:hypothetical protein
MIHKVCGCINESETEGEINDISLPQQRYRADEVAHSRCQIWHATSLLRKLTNLRRMGRICAAGDELPRSYVVTNYVRAPTTPLWETGTQTESQGVVQESSSENPSELDPESLNPIPWPGGHTASTAHWKGEGQ